jgi:hypothetical protein
MHSQTLDSQAAELIAITGERSEQYRSAWWLKSDFSAHTWDCEFGADHFQIDFRISIDGHDLTSPKFADLLDIFKCWICLQTHPDFTGGRKLAPRSAYNSVTLVLRIIDYLLLNSSHLHLSEYGLEILTESDLYKFLFDICSARTSAESIYRWTDALRTHLISESTNLHQSIVTETILKCPLITSLDFEDDAQSLSLSKEELLYSRIYLWRTGLYLRGNERFRHSPNTHQLSNVIYKNTLWGKSVTKSVHTELCFGKMQRYYKEKEGVPVRTGLQEQCSEQTLQLYWSALRSMGILASIGLKVPTVALNTISYRHITQIITLKPRGRFKTLPKEVCLEALRNGIEFFLQHSEHLLESYFNVLSAAQAKGVNCWELSSIQDITPFLTEATAAMGVKTWHLTQKIAMLEANHNKLTTPRISTEIYFSRFRKNEGLLELLRVLIGSIQIVLGTLMARRQGELSDLKAGECLDRTGRYLIFYNRKSGTEGVREQEARPIPPIAARMIKCLETMQHKVLSIGLDSGNISLFSHPDPTGLSLSDGNSEDFNRLLDIFCDYFQTPLNLEGKRYYIRQHQLRRFFAMVFFWGNSFGGMDTLRWFLGHTDVEHLYHYITESTSGEVLRSVKAHFAGEQLKNGSTEADALAILVKKHFGTPNFSVLDNDELDEYIEELMFDGKVKVEPEFFQSIQGQTFRILIKVAPIESAI